MAKRPYNSDTLECIGECLVKINEFYDRLHRSLYEGKETDIGLDISIIKENTKKMMHFLDSIEEMI